MKNLICIILIISVSLTLASKIQIDKEKNDFKQKLEKLLTQEKSDNKYLFKLMNLYATVQELSADKSEMSKFNICPKLKTIDSSSLEDDEILFYYAAISFGGCKVADNDKVLEKIIIQGRQSENLNEFFRSFILGYQYKQFQTDKILADNCDKVLDFVDQTGAARLVKKRSNDLSYEESFKIYKMGNICFQNVEALQENEKFKSTFNKAISSFVLNSAQINEQERGMFEGCALKTTAKNVQFIKSLNKYIKNSDFNNVFPQYLNFLTNSYTDSECSIGKGAVLRFLKSQETYPLISLKSKEIQLVENQEKFVLKARLQNVFGASMTKSGSLGLKQKISLLFGTETVIDNVSVKKNEDSDYNIEFEFDTKKITQAGYYTLQMSVKFTNNSDSYIIREIIKVTAKATVDQIKFETTNTKTFPSIFKNKVSFSQVFSEKQVANQNSFMHIQFKVNTPKTSKIDIKQVAVKLINKQFTYATNLVTATLDKNSQNYKVTIDFGDPDHVLPYSDEYECELIVADQFLTENIKWKFAKLDVTFRKPAQKKPKQDTDYETEKPITHMFPSPVPNPPSIVTLGFCGIMVCAIILFVGILLKLDLNFNKLFKNFLQNIGFFSLILAYIGVLVLFWTKINLFQTLLLFVILLPFTLIVGNASLIALKDDKQKQD